MMEWVGLVWFGGDLHLETGLFGGLSYATRDLMCISFHFTSTVLTEVWVQLLTVVVSAFVFIFACLCFGGFHWNL